MNDPELELKRHYAGLVSPPTAALEARVMTAVAAAAPPPSRSGRRLAVLAASLAAATAIGWALYAPPAPPKESPAVVQEPRPEEIAARINGEPILWKDLNARFFKDYKPSDITEELRKSALRQHAEELIFRQFALRKKLTVTDAELDEAIQRDIQSYGSREEYEKVVRIRHGTAAKAREVRRDELLLFKAYGYVLRSLNTDPELQGLRLESEEIPRTRQLQYYEANPRHFEGFERISFTRIGLSFAGAPEEEAKRALLESIRRKQEIGSDFALLAYYCTEVRGAKKIIESGVTRKDLEATYVPETIRTLFESLKEGEVSSIIKDGATLNLFKLEQKLSQPAMPFEAAQDRIRSMLENQVREENRGKIRNLLRRNARLDPPDLFEEK